MITSKHIYTYEMEEREGHTLLTAQQWPWCVLQVVPTTPENFKAAVAQSRHARALWRLMAPTAHFASCKSPVATKEDATPNGTSKFADRKPHESILTL